MPFAALLLSAVLCLALGVLPARLAGRRPARRDLAAAGAVFAGVWAWAFLFLASRACWWILACSGCARSAPRRPRRRGASARCAAPACCGGRAPGAGRGGAGIVRADL